MRRIGMALVLFSVSFVACGCGSSVQAGDQDVTEHPSEERVLRPGQLSVVDVSREIPDNTSEMDRFTTAATVLRDLPAAAVARIGAVTGSKDSVIGTIVDVAIDKHGTVYLLDGRYLSIRVYGSGGEFKYTLGRAGGGPGEFFLPKAISLSPDELTLGVLDGRNRRVSIYQRSSSTERFRHLEDRKIVLAPYDFCVAEKGFVLHGFDREEAPSPLLYLLEDQGNIVRRFGKIYDSENFIVGYKISTGQIECDRERRRIVLAPENLPEIRSFSIDGSTLSMTRFSDVVPLAFTEEDGAVQQMVREGAEGFHALASLEYWGDRFVVAQFRYATEESERQREPHARLDTYLIDPESGEGRFVGSGVPQLYEMSPPYAVSGVHEPYPQLTIHRFGR